ncbi:hypothetical protein ABW19_dt0202893 [Dactylella cylindrospora]|nr:hypothetical protein ABW19_dt0202893 [Dactylella cylindrospora]
MNHHQYQQIPPQGPYIPAQMMGGPHHHQQHHHPHHPPYPPHPQHGPTISNMSPYSHHPPPPSHPQSQTPDFRPPHHFHQPNRPLIVSTPTSYVPQYPHAMPHPMANPFYRPPQIHTSMQPYYSTQEVPQPPLDIPSPASLPREPLASNPASSPARSAEAVEETGEIRYETPITSSSSVPPSPMIPILPPLSSGATFKRPLLPWYSVPGEPFPPRVTKASKKPSLPFNSKDKCPGDVYGVEAASPIGSGNLALEPKKGGERLESNRLDEEIKDVNGTVVGTDAPVPSVSETSAPPLAQDKIFKQVPRSSIPVPVVPFIPAIHKSRKSADIGTGDSDKAPSPHTETGDVSKAVEGSEVQAKPEVVPATATPKSWADLVRSKSAQTPTQIIRPAQTTTNGIPPPGNPEAQQQSLATILRSFHIPKQVASSSEFSPPLIEPRGLINTGNMCFMNSILQALLFCGPFFVFLESIGKNVAHSFKSETPLIDAMIMFTREFRRIPPNNSLPSDQRGADSQLAGDPFVPEYVYEAVKGLKRFSSMRRGHQQDAEEFLNFFLDVLHEECVAAIKLGQTSAQQSTAPKIEAYPPNEDDDAGWLEVGHKQKTAITRNIGHISGVSPVTTIFGGQMRNELRVSGQRSSVMREPYQSLQLDIQSSDINNIIDALRQISIPEQLQGGDFKSARGASVSATKQTFIDNLPPVLILHLKRFQYNNTGGTQKIWKGIGYPLELDIPAEALSPTNRSSQKRPKYKLISVVYHHGKSATNGHYTVDVRRQDGWIRIDDTIVKRIQENDLLADAGQSYRESRKRDGNEENGWKEVNFATKVSGKAQTVSSTSTREDKVAYLLFYERQ